MDPPSAGVILWVALILFIMTFGKYILGFSHKDFFVTIVSELKDLGNLKFSIGALNALGAIAVITLSVLYGFSSSVRQVISLLGSSPKDVSGIDFSEIIVIVLVVAFYQLLCVHLCKNNSDQ